MSIPIEKEQIHINSWFENQDGDTEIVGRALANLLRGFKKGPMNSAPGVNPGGLW